MISPFGVDHGEFSKGFLRPKVARGYKPGMGPGESLESIIRPKTVASKKPASDRAQEAVRPNLKASNAAYNRRANAGAQRLAAKFPSREKYNYR